MNFLSVIAYENCLSSRSCHRCPRLINYAHLDFMAADESAADKECDARCEEQEVSHVWAAGVGR
jgi:hypothetical protein